MGERLTLTVGSLFAGIGGLDLGLERAGMAVKWQVENDPWCCRVLAKHWPEIPRYGDIHGIDPTTLEPVDLIAGGFPCQPVSLAGKQLAQDDPRWLWPEFARVLRGVRPRYVLVENVPGLAVRGMGDVLGDLAVLGYDAEWASIPAAAVGAPHLRYRIFIVAYSDSNGRQGRPEYHSEPAGRIFSERLAWNDAHGLALAERRTQEALSRFRGMDDGLPSWVDRLRGLGNAVVPQVAEWVGRRIIAHHDQL